MNRWDYNFGVPLADAIRIKLENLGMVHKEHPTAHTPGFEKNTFAPDGYPKLARPDTVYPSLLFKTIGIAISENVTLVESGYRQQAALAALKWTEKLFAKDTLRWHFDGIYFNQQVDGQQINFCFPNTSILIQEGNDTVHCAVMAFPESHHDDEYWEKGMIPQYAMMQAQLTLWCSRQYAAIHSDYLQMDKAVLVRIKGNTAADVSVRMISYDPQQVSKILRRLAREIALCNASGSGYHEKLNLIPAKNWKEEKELDIENAYCIDSDAFHDLLMQYMAARSDRKRLESESNAIKNEMDNIAIMLASQIGDSNRSGTVDAAGAKYTVTQNPKRASGVKISADLIRQLAPECVDAIHTNIVPRGRIEIEVL